MNIQTKRLTAEIRKAKKERKPEFYIFPEGDNLRKWNGFLIGPKDTPYEKTAFQIKITLDQNHPISPPKVNFITKIFHPNINWKTGEVCIDILKTEWSPMWSLITLERAITSILVYPNADSPLNCDAGNMIRSGDEAGFFTTAQFCSENFGICLKDYLEIFDGEIC